MLPLTSPFLSPPRSSLFIFRKCHHPSRRPRFLARFFLPANILTPPFPLSFLLFVHSFSSSLIISPLRSSFLLFAHHFSSSFVILPLRSSFFLLVHRFSFLFMISLLPSSFLLFVHRFSSSPGPSFFRLRLKSSFIFSRMRSKGFLILGGLGAGPCSFRFWDCGRERPRTTASVRARPFCAPCAVPLGLASRGVAWAELCGAAPL